MTQQKHQRNSVEGHDTLVENQRRNRNMKYYKFPKPPWEYYLKKKVRRNLLAAAINSYIRNLK